MTDSAPSPSSLAAPLVALRSTWLAAIAVIAELGTGKRSRAYRIRWADRDCVLKLYDPAACAKHARRHPVPLARYEYRRNRALYQVPGLQAHIARPFVYWVDGDRQAFVQEYLPGTLYEHYRDTAPDTERETLIASLKDIVARAHGAGLYDLDLHPNNVMVCPDESGGRSLKLYDFNKVPFHELPPNPLAALLLALRLVRPESRDLRRLYLFTDPRGRSRLGTRRQ